MQSDRGGQLVFHLDETAANRWDARGEAFDDLRGRRDWISGSEACAGCQGTFAAGMVAVDEVSAGEYAVRVSLHRAPLFSRPAGLEADIPSTGTLWP